MTKAPNARSQTNHDSSIWRDGPGGTWYMLSGGCTYKDGNKPEGACSGTGQLWNSTDLVTFTYMHAITPGGPGGYWELPYLLPFNADGSAIDNYHHNGAAVYALLFGHGNAYYVGGYNDTTKSFLPLDAVSLSFASWNRSTLTEIYLCHACSCQELLFSSWNRSTLTEIYLCHACSCHDIEDGNGRAGARAAPATAQPTPAVLCPGHTAGELVTGQRLGRAERRSPRCTGSHHRRGASVRRRHGFLPRLVYVRPTLSSSGSASGLHGLSDAPAACGRQGEERAGQGAGQAGSELG
jgi:hypothetical protein